jgi:Leucine-rich repeat (LRR) protein
LLVVVVVVVVRPEILGKKKLQSQIKTDRHCSGLFFSPWICPSQHYTVRGIDNNQVEGALPKELGSLSTLRTLNLESNTLSGSLSSYNFPSQLTTLRLAHNRLTETLPPSLLGQLSLLQHLDLQDNLLTASLPLLESSSLETLSLAKNSFTGDMTTAFSSLIHLQSLDISNNRLTGRFDFLLKLIQLEYVDMSRNYGPSGTLPYEIATTLTQLSVLRAGYCNVTGSIPTDIGLLTTLRELSLMTNKLTGSIPESMGRLTKLTKLDLSGNSLTGSIAQSLVVQLTELQELRLGNNRLTGSLPDIATTSTTTGSGGATAGWTSLQILSLQNNILNGTLPKTTLGTWTALREMNLAENQFTGTLPSTLGNLIALSQLKLSKNDFTGTFPQTLQSLSNLSKCVCVSVFVSVCVTKQNQESEPAPFVFFAKQWYVIVSLSPSNARFCFLFQMDICSRP